MIPSPGRATLLRLIPHARNTAALRGDGMSNQQMVSCFGFIFCFAGGTPVLPGLSSFDTGEAAAADGNAKYLVVGFSGILRDGTEGSGGWKVDC